jgi:DNA-binding NarL/FixJ family response regulator
MAKAALKQKKAKTIFIVDDHPVFREGLAGLVKRDGQLAICGEADNAAQGLAEIERLQPDLVLVDIGLPSRSGLELVKDLQALRPELAVLVISMYDETLYAERVLRAGGRGYIMKQEGPGKILQAIREVLDGQIFVSPRISRRVLAALSSRQSGAKSPIAGLTDREFEILRLIGQGKDSHAIAQQLNLSFKTVDVHRGHIREKLNLKSYTELICYAARWLEAQKSDAE